MLEKLAAARELGVTGLISRFIWRLQQVFRVLAFRLWRCRGAEDFAAVAPGVQISSIASYLPPFEKVCACYEREAGARANDSKERIRAAAKRICENRINVRGSGEIDLNFASRNWYSYERGAAIMLNRHDFLLPLVQAHVLENLADASVKIHELFRYWIENFEPARLRDSDTPIDAAIRLLNWAWVFNSNMLSLDTRKSEELRRIIALQLEYIYAWQSAGGNHLVLEALAAYVYGAMFPSRHGSRWSAWGRRTLLKQLLRQTTPDGVHTEQSMFYHQAVTTHFLKFFLTADRQKDRLAEQYRDRFALMLDYVHETAKPSLGHPVLGDGEALVTDDREHWEARALLAARAVMFAKPVSQSFLPMIDDSSVWILGYWPGDLETTLENPRSKVLEHSGLAVFRGEDTYVLLDAAPFSDPEFPHHGHADALSIEVCAGKDDLFVDPGGYGYYDDDFRRFFRSTAAHNTITVGDSNQSELFGVLGYGRLCKASLLQHEISDDYDYALASHDGYSPAIHQRSLYLLKRPRQCLIIVDWLEKVDGQVVVSRLHAAQGCRVDLDAGQVVSGKTLNAYGIACDASSPISTTTRCGEKSGGLQGWVSPETHQAVPAVTWEGRINDVSECTLVTVIALEPALDVAVSVLGPNQADLVIGESRLRLVREKTRFSLQDYGDDADF